MLCKRLAKKTLGISMKTKTKGKQHWEVLHPRFGECFLDQVNDTEPLHLGIVEFTVDEVGLIGEHLPATGL